MKNEEEEDEEGEEDEEDEEDEECQEQPQSTTMNHNYNQPQLQSTTITNQPQLQPTTIKHNEPHFNQPQP